MDEGPWGDGGWRWGDGDGRWGGSGVREPRRPGPKPPVGAVALDEPSGPGPVRRGSALRNVRGENEKR
jgi:hypothetical protein